MPAMRVEVLSDKFVAEFVPVLEEEEGGEVKDLDCLGSCKWLFMGSTFLFSIWGHEEW